jgi:hypothetical protein
MLSVMSGGGETEVTDDVQHGKDFLNFKILIH